MAFTILVHPDVNRSLSSLDASLRESVDRKLSWALLQLAATGRSIRVKGTVGQVWRRTPVHGNSHYLWWTQAQELSTPTVLVRDLRHHDILDEPSECDLVHYEHVSPANLDPRTAPQRKISQVSPGCTVSVRCLKGLPGTGKTVGLYGVARDHQVHGKVLYLTSSNLLAAEARAHFEATSCPEIQVSTFAELLSAYTHAPKQSDSTLRRRFMAFLETRGRPLAGSLCRYPEALWDLLRGFCIGHALNRSWKRGNRNVEACDFLSSGILSELTGVSEDLAVKIRAVALGASEEGIFEDLISCRRATESLAEFSPISALVVDEVQDLTAIELDFLLKAGKVQAQSDTLIVFAGDESQTVQASGFSWGLLKDLAGSRLGVEVKDVDLEDPLRSVPHITRIVSASSGLYREIPKEIRPRSVRKMQLPDSDTLDEGVLVVPCPDLEQLATVLSELPGRSLIFADDFVPEALRGSGVVFAASEAKGLERRLVVVANLGESAARLSKTDSLEKDLDEILRRRIIDAIRVSLSRATDTLVLVKGEVPFPISLELGNTREVSWEELETTLKSEELGAYERAEGFLREAAELLERGAIEQAEERAQKASACLDQIGNCRLRSELDELRNRLEIAKENQNILYVAADGTGDFRTLQEALSIIKEQGTIFVRPGTYDVSNTVVDKGILVSGFNGPSRTIFRAKGEAGLILSGEEEGFIRGITLDNPEDNSTTGIVVKSGKWQLEKLVISGTTAVRLHSGATVAVINSKLVGKNGSGFEAVEGSFAHLEFLDVTATGAPAIYCKQTKARLNQVTVRNSSAGGIKLEGCSSNILNCEIFGGEFGVMLCAGAESTVMKSRTEGCATGVYLDEATTARIDDCVVLRSKNVGIFAAAGVKTAIINTQVRIAGKGVLVGIGRHHSEGLVVEDTDGPGIEIRGKSETGNICFCKFRLTRTGGLDMRDGAEVIGDSFEIQSAKKDGIYSQELCLLAFAKGTISNSGGNAITAIRSAGYVESLQILNCGAVGILCAASKLDVKSSTIKGCREAGIFYAHHTTGEILGNTIMHCKGGSITIDQESSPTVRLNTIREGGRNAFMILRKSGGIIQSNTVEGFSGDGFLLHEASDVQILDNVIRNTGACGISLTARSDAQVERNTISGHPRAGIIVSEYSALTAIENTITNSPLGIEIYKGATATLLDNETTGARGLAAHEGSIVHGKHTKHTYEQKTEETRPKFVRSTSKKRTVH